MFTAESKRNSIFIILLECMKGAGVAFCLFLPSVVAPWIDWDVSRPGSLTELAARYNVILNY